MKRNKKLILLSSIAISATTLPAVAISCSVNKYTEKDLEEQKVQYKQAYATYDEKLVAYGKELSKLKKAIDKASDKEAKDAAKKTRNDFVIEKRAELKPLRQAMNEAFTKLQEMQKQLNPEVVITKIIHTNDEHGRLRYDDYKYNNYSGMEGVAQFMKNAVKGLLLSAGDMVQGLALNDSDKGVTITKIAKEAGYDAVAVGNHEFDYGLEHMLDIDKNVATKAMPFLSANIVWNNKAKEKDDSRQTGEFVFTPSLVKELPNGTKVGIIGITTPDTTYTSNPKSSELVTFLDPIQSANKEAAKLTKQGVNFIIAITHLGVGRNKKEWDSEYFIEKVSNIDLVLDGHSHTKVEIKKATASNTSLTQTEAYTKYISEIDIEFNTKTGEIVSTKQSLRPIEEIELIARDEEVPVVEKLIKDLEKLFDEKNNVVVATNSVRLTHVDNIKVVETDTKEFQRGRVQQTNLGVWAADGAAWKLVEWKPHTSEGIQYSADNVVGLYNGGSLRQDLGTGEIKRKDMLNTEPYGNRLVVLEVTGAVLLEVMQHGAAKTNSGGFAQWSSNVKARIQAYDKDGQRAYRLVDNSVMINDKALVADQKYYIATNDYLAIGGDQYAMLDYAKSPKSTLHAEGDLLLDVITDYMKYTNKENFTESTTNDFGKKAISWYGTDQATSNVVSVHTYEASAS